MVAKRDGSEKNYIFPDSAFWYLNAVEDVLGFQIISTLKILTISTRIFRKPISEK